MYINIHSHYTVEPNVRGIQNLYKDFEMAQNSGNYSVGLHPWFIHNDSWEIEFAKLQQISRMENIKAIGECGLDKICNTDFAFQMIVFSKQVELANQIGKPLIIHCVRSYVEVIAVLNSNQTKVPVVFHGFNKNLKLAQRLINQGYYISFGKDIFQKRIQEVLLELPLDKIFFETDDSSLLIQSIYETAAAALKNNVDLLCLQIEKNATKVFNL